MPMPKATVYKNNSVIFFQNNIRLSREVLNIFSVSETMRKQIFSNYFFWLMDKLRRLEYIKRIDRYYDDYKKLGSYVYAIPVIRGRAFFFVNRRFLRFGLTAAQTRMYLYCCKCADSRSMRFWNSYNVFVPHCI